MFQNGMICDLGNLEGGGVPMFLLNLPSLVVKVTGFGGTVE